MKKQLAGLSILFLFSSLIIISCKKSDTKEKDFNTEASVQSDDQNQFSNQLDAVANETNVFLETTGTLAYRGQEMQDLVCNATAVADSSGSARTITITYNGADCMGYFNRTGTVTVTIPAGVHWKNAGAAITVNYTNLVVTRVQITKALPSMALMLSLT